MPFGGGSRICIGMHFAVMEAQIIALHVLRKVKFQPVDGFEPQIALHVTMTSVNGIMLRAIPRGKDV
uniref:Cytochrome p450 family protein n=1 Tax=Tetraselmis sp. GSL018 TaxID=582737 RepID=A0A061QJB2_9CHLO